MNNPTNKIASSCIMYTGRRTTLRPCCTDELLDIVNCDECLFTKDMPDIHDLFNRAVKENE